MNCDQSILAIFEASTSDMKFVNYIDIKELAMLAINEIVPNSGSMHEEKSIMCVATNKIVCCFCQHALVLGDLEGIKCVELLHQHVRSAYNPVVFFDNRKVELQKCTIVRKISGLGKQHDRVKNGKICDHDGLCRTHKVIFHDLKFCILAL